MNQPITHQDAASSDVVERAQAQVGVALARLESALEKLAAKAPTDNGDVAALQSELSALRSQNETLQTAVRESHERVGRVIETLKNTMDD